MGVVENTSKNYKYDLHGSVIGYTGQNVATTYFDGVAVIPKAEKYALYIESRTDIDMLRFRSCDLDKSFESVIEQGWFKKKRGFTFWFIPSEKQKQLQCIMRIGAYSKDVSGPIAWAAIDFESDNYKAIGYNSCNNETPPPSGVTFCQIQNGLLHYLAFKNPMQLAPSGIPDRCTLPTTTDNKVWEFRTPKGECLFLFREIAPTHLLHRHTSYGYDEVIVRGSL